MNLPTIFRRPTTTNIDVNHDDDRNYAENYQEYERNIWEMIWSLAC